MKFQIEDITVYFPYDNIYPEQYSYMVELKRALDAKGHCLLEMPTGTGKTIALLSLITSYALSKPSNPIKLIYCTRTVHEMEKTLAELKVLHDYQVFHLGPSARLLALGLSSRKNLCINPAVVSAENRDSVDAGCRKLTASWVRALAVENPNIPTCSFFEDYEKSGSEAILPQVYQYLLDPKVAGIISKEMQRESVVVFDEAHNIDNVCIEALSVSVRRQTLEGATRNISRMSQEIERFKATDAGKLRAEYNRLVEVGDTWLSNPALPEDILKEAVPGNIRRAEHFLSVLRRPLFERFQTVVITSGTLSPIDLYPRLLNFNPVVCRSFTMSFTRDCICPMVLTRGSYSYMDAIVNTWNETGILKDIMQHKLVFIETQDVVETTLALDNYRKACDCGRGAVFFSVARGKVAEGIDFDRHYGRLVIMYGVPFQYTLSKILLARLEYLRDTFQIKEGEFLTFDALRQAAQCVGRVIRSKADYGMMIFADKRYSRHDKRSKLPGWILSHLRDAYLNLSTDMALHIAREFLRKMAQPYDKTSASGKRTLLSQEDVEKMSNAGADETVHLEKLYSELDEINVEEKIKIEEVAKIRALHTAKLEEARVLSARLHQLREQRIACLQKEIHAIRSMPGYAGNDTAVGNDQLVERIIEEDKAAEDDEEDDSETGHGGRWSSGSDDGGGEYPAYDDDSGSVDSDAYRRPSPTSFTILGLSLVCLCLVV
uniref:DNA 5'-3' helicase n=1 Tax=Chenopodium quinoa TaxID=63459 RepID=A0A803NDK6_CHEQI